MKNIRHNQQGQSLLELLIALFILVSTLTATIALIVTSINAGRESRNKLIGTSLAREGIELVRNIRDSNWLDDTGPVWDEGLNDGAGDDTTAIPVIDGTSAFGLDFSKNDFTAITYDSATDAYYQGDAAPGANSQFYRIMNINAICRASNGDETIISANSPSNDCSGDDEVGLRIVSEVRWPSQTSSKKIILEDRLYNWQVL